MALANENIAIRVTLKDLGNDTSTKSYPTTLNLDVDTFADAVTARDALIAELDPVTAALIDQVDIVVSQKEDTAVVGSGEINNRALVSCALATPGKPPHNIIIPAAVPAIFLAASGPDFNVVNTANADLAAYIALFVTGGAFTLSDGEQLAATNTIRSGKRQHRGAKKG